MGVELDFQAAIVARIKAAAVGTGFTTLAVYDLAPQADPPSGWPYVTVADTIVTNAGVDEVDTFEIVTRVHSWSRHKGVREVLKMQGEIYAALHNFTLLLPRYGAASLSDLVCFSLLRESTTTLPDPSGTFHGVCQYRALIEPS